MTGPIMTGRLSAWRRRGEAASGSTTVLRAAVLAAALATLYCRRIIWSSYPPAADGLAGRLLSLGAVAVQDLAVLLLFALMATLFETFWPRRLAAALMTLIAAVLVIAAVANVFAMHIVGTPIDIHWLFEVKPRDAGTALPMVTAYVSDGMTRAAALSLLLVPLLSWLVMRFLPIPACVMAAVLAIGAAGALLCQQSVGATRWSAEKRLTYANPAFVELERLIWPSPNLAFLNGYVAPGKPPPSAGFAVRGITPARFGCCKDHNVVLITLDSVPSRTIATIREPHFAAKYPNITRLFAQGVEFTNFYSNFPMSAQSMGAMATSLYPSFSPLLTTMEEVHDRDVQILPSVLARHGYEGAIFMGGQLRYAGAAELLKGRGLATIEDSDTLKCRREDRRVLAIYAHLGDDCTGAAAARWLKLQANRKFFLWAWFTNPHSPYFELSRATKGGTLGSRQQHLAALTETDKAIGLLMRTVEESGLQDNTVFVLLADHGEAFGEHGQLNHGTSVFEEQVHVPLVIAGARLGRAYRANPVVGGTVDLAPTILDLLGIDTPAGWQGRSMFSPDHPNRAYFASRRSGKMVGFREGRRKFVVSSLEDGVHAYDLVADPGERRPVLLSQSEQERVRNEVGAFVAYRNSLTWPPLKKPPH